MDPKVWQRFPTELFLQHVVPRLMYAQQVALASHLPLIRAAYPSLLTLKDDTVWLLKFKHSTGKIKFTRYHYKESELRLAFDEPRIGVYQQPGKPDQRARLYYRCKREMNRNMNWDLDLEDISRDIDRKHLDLGFEIELTDEDLKAMDKKGYETEGHTDDEDEEEDTSIWIDEGVAFPTDSIDSVQPLHSAHGLVLFSVRTPVDCPYMSFAVVNPLTKRIKLLKPCADVLPYDSVHWAMLEVNKVKQSYRIYAVRACYFIIYDSVSQSWEFRVLEDEMDAQVGMSRIIPFDKNNFALVVKNHKVLEKYDLNTWNVGKLGFVKSDIPRFQIYEKTLPIFCDKFYTYALDSLDGTLTLAGKSHKKNEKFCLYEILLDRVEFSNTSERRGILSQENRPGNTGRLRQDRNKTGGDEEDRLGNTGSLAGGAGENRRGNSEESENSKEYKHDKFEVKLRKLFVLKSNRETEMMMKVNANAEGYYWVETTTRGMTLWKTPEGTYEVLSFRHDFSDRANISYPFCPSLLNP